MAIVSRSFSLQAWLSTSNSCLHLHCTQSAWILAYSLNFIAGASSDWTDLWSVFKLKFKETLYFGLAPPCWLDVWWLLWDYPSPQLHDARAPPQEVTSTVQLRRHHFCHLWVRSSSEGSNFDVVAGPGNCWLQHLYPLPLLLHEAILQPCSVHRVLFYLLPACIFHSHHPV